MFPVPRNPVLDPTTEGDKYVVDYSSALGKEE